MRQAVVAGTVAVLALTVSGCSLADAFGPTPHPTVLRLAQVAQADAAAWPEDSGALRAHHAADLAGEVERLCGVDEAGQVPESCAVELAGAEATPDAAAALAVYVEALPAVPEESRDVVTHQAVNLAGLVAELPETPTLSDADAERARDLLLAEHATVYALDMAQAYADGAERERLAGLIDAHGERIAVLEEALEPTGDVPAAPAGYSFADLPHPSDGARAFADHIETTLVSTWLATVADIDADSDSLTWFLLLAGDAEQALAG